MKVVISAALMATLVGLPAFAQDAANNPYMQQAIDSGICGDAEVRTATFVTERNTIEVTCEEEPAGIFPLAGGLAPALIAGGAALAVAGLSSTSGT